MAQDLTQRILVTGGTGFTGTHLVRRLLRKGHEVIVIDNQRGAFFEELQTLGAQITLGSITDKELVDHLVEGCHIVHHLAAAFRMVNLPKAVYWDVNVNGTRNLLEASQKHRVRKFIYCSTQGVHGDVNKIPADETAPIIPADYYQYTKYEGEKVAQEFIDCGLNVTVLRPTAIYGPGDLGRWLLLFKRVAPGRFLMFGNGRTFYHPLNIDNLIDAFELAMQKDEANGQTYLVGDNRYYTLNELVMAVGEALGIEVSIIYLPFWPLWVLASICEIAFKPLRIEPPLFRRRVDWFRQNRAFDISKIKRELGYQPQVDLRKGLSITAQWYRENGYL